MLILLQKLLILLVGVFLIISVSNAGDLKEKYSVITIDGSRLQVSALFIKYSDLNTEFNLPLNNNQREIILSTTMTANGEKVTETIKQEWIGGTWVNLQKNNYSYDASGNLTQSITQKWSGTEWINTMMIINTYDVNNFMTETRTKVWRNNAWKDYARYLITLDEVNHYLLYTVQQYDTTGGLWINFLHMTYYLDSTHKIFLGGLQELWSAGVSSWINFKKDTIIYDANYYKLEELNQDWVGNAWVNTERTVYTNDATGHKLTEMEQNWEVSDWVNYALYTYARNVNHEIDTSVYQHWESNTWVNKWKDIYSYDTQDREIENIEQNWISNAWINTSKTATSYDSYGNTSQELRQSWVSNAWVNNRNYVTTIDANGNLTEELWQNWDVNTTSWINDERQSHTYGAVNLVENMASIIPESFSLEQNYPNPFNPTTNLGFKIADRGFVSLKVYNVLGHEVAIIVNEELPQGEYSVKWNASNYSSGVYYYRLTVQSMKNTYILTKQLLLIK